MAVTLEEGGSDLYGFLSLFTTEVFPETKKLPWHITGESMGGHFVTGYTKYIVQQQRERNAHRLPGTLAIDIATAIIVDGYIEVARSTAGLYDYLCLDWRNDGHEPLVRDAAACASMAAGVPQCEAKAALCRATYDKEVCILAADHCNATVAGYFWEHVKPGGWNPYDRKNPSLMQTAETKTLKLLLTDRATCDVPPLCSDMQGGPTFKYLNQPWVLDRLGYPGKSLSLIDMDANQRWQRDGHLFLPATRELQWLLDETEIRVLFINGNEDMTM